MDLDKLKSVITKIRMASVAIKKAFQDIWQSEHLRLANKLVSVIEGGITVTRPDNMKVGCISFREEGG